MEAERFQKLLDELDGNSLQTLKEKNARYAQNGDCLHNFRSGAEISGGTPAQACWGYVTKHLVALRDMVERDNFSNREDFLEKCQDTINYIRFLWCIGNDTSDEVVSEQSNKETFKWGFVTKSEAESTLAWLRLCLADRGFACIADIYLSMHQIPYESAYDHVWYDLSDSVVKIYEGSHATWVLELPKYESKI